MDPQPDALAVAYCMPPDPNQARGEDVLTPVAGRVSTSGLREAYLSANVALLARVAVYAGTCEGGAGLEGEAECRGTREGRAGLYVRDNTPGNFLTTLTCARPTCWTAENDCRHATYEESARRGESWCQRDNTGLGLMLVLP